MESYLHNLIQEFLKEGHQVTLWVNKIDTKLKVPQGLNLKLLRHSFLPKFLQKWYFVFALPQKLRESSQEVIISTTRSLYQDITVVGGTHRGYLNSLKQKRIKDFAELWLEKEAYRHSKKIVAHSPMIAEELRSLYPLPPDKITMIYPPVDAQKFTFTPHVTTKPFKLLFPSTSHRRKGGGILLSAFKLLPPSDFELWIAGRPFREAEQLASVKYLGFVDLSAIYPQADLMVLPSWFEPFGLVAVEALQCGTPVLVSKFTAVKALIAEQEGLVLEDMRPEALAELILKAKDYPFKVEPNFIERHGLTVPKHVQALLALVA